MSTGYLYSVRIAAVCTHTRNTLYTLTTIITVIRVQASDNRVSNFVKQKQKHNELYKNQTVKESETAGKIGKK